MALSQITVKLIDHMGDDLRIVNAARQSFGKESLEYGEREQGIHSALMREEHAGPFEAGVIQYQVHAPIRVAREHMRHRTASYSEYSLRYAPFPNEFFVWTPEDIRAQVGKAMDYNFEPMSPTLAAQCANIMNTQAQEDLDVYNTLLGLGVAKEVASYRLPLDSMTIYSVTSNLRNILNYLHVRNAAPALREIRHVAVILEEIVKECFPCTYHFWDERGRPKL